VLWVKGEPGPDLRTETHVHWSFTHGLHDLLAELDRPDLSEAALAKYAQVTIRIVPTAYFNLVDADNYALVRVGYVADRVDIADGFFQEVCDQEDEQFCMLLLAQLLELHAPGVTRPDSTSAALVRDEALLMHRGTRGLLSTQRRYVAAQLRRKRVEAVLARYVSTSDLPAADRAFLEEDLLTDLETASMCGLTHAGVGSVLERRLKLLAEVYDPLRSLLRERLCIEDLSPSQLWHVFMPVAEWLIERAQARERAHPGEAYVVGLSGAQGSGKTTVQEILGMLLATQGFPAAGFSLDDIYKTHEDRKALAAQCAHYRFRGPPGTHDVKLGLDTLRALRHSQEGGVVEVPVFDKSLHEGDGDRLPRNQWRKVRGKVRMAMIDGWCFGARAQGDSALAEPVSAIEASSIYDDEQGTFRKRIDDELRQYHELFDECDDLIVLEVPNLDSIYRWRGLQEAKLRAETGRGMDETTVRAFVDYFLPVTERYMMRLAEDPAGGASLVLTLGDDHAIRRVRRMEQAVGNGRPDRYLSIHAEEEAKARFRRPERCARRALGTAVVIADGVGLAPIDRDNPLFHCETPLLDALASPQWSPALGLDRADTTAGVAEGVPPMPPFLKGAQVLGTCIHASSVELGLKKGQPGDSSVGHASLGMGGYGRRYIGLIWDTILSGAFGENEAVRQPIEHVLVGRSRYAHPKLHLWGMCSRGYIHADIEILFEILKLCAQHGLRREEVIIHFVTDGKDVPKDTSAEFVRELEEVLHDTGVGMIGTICGRDGWMCNRDRTFLRARNAPAARCVIEGVGVLPDVPSALAAIMQGKASEAGKKYGDDIDRFLPPTHIQGVRSQVESGDAMLCFNLREDRSVLFPQAFIFPLVDNGRLRDFVYSTLIELRTLKTRRPYHLEAFRQNEPGDRVPLTLVHAGYVVRTFAESEKGQEVSNTYMGGHAATIRKRLGALSTLLDVDPDRYPQTPTRPDKAPEMKAGEVADLIRESMGDGVAMLANLCNGDVIGHYGRQELTQASMKVVDRELGRVLEEARKKGVVVLLVADHGCVETWGPMHSANLVPFHAVFPERLRAMGKRLIPGAGTKALTDVEPTRLALLGVFQDAHLTGDSILVPDIDELSDEEVISEVLRAAALGDFSLLRRCPDGARIRRVLTLLMDKTDRQAVRMFILRLGARVAQLRHAQSPYLSELTDRLPEELLAALTPPGEEIATSPDGSLDAAALPPQWADSTRVVSTAAGAKRTLVCLADLTDPTPDGVKAMAASTAGRSIPGVIVQGRDLDRIEEDVQLAVALGASHLIVGHGLWEQTGTGGAPDLSELLASVAKTAAREGLGLLIENESPGSRAEALAVRRAIGSLLAQGAPFGVLLNVENAAAAAASTDGQDEMDEIVVFLSDRVLSSHIEGVRVREGDERGRRVVAYLREQAIDVPILIEGRVIASATGDASLLRRACAVAQPVGCHNDRT
jgi:D-glycerate 3-kinase